MVFEAIAGCIRMDVRAVRHVGANILTKGRLVQSGRVATVSGFLTVATRSGHVAVDKPPVQSWPLTTGDAHLDTVNPFSTELPGAMLLHGWMDVGKTYHGPEACGP
jgi:hypothetical protein